MNKKFLKTAIILVLGSFVAVSLVFVLILFATKGISCQPSTSKAPLCSQEQASALSLSLIRNSPTFAFDGVKDSIQQVKVVSPDKGSTWNLTYSFKTAHPGHGDRSEQMLAQVVTGHTAQITVAKCKITSAVCDKTWNLLTNSQP
jgi:hypothetical protein